MASSLEIRARERAGNVADLYPDNDPRGACARAVLMAMKTIEVRLHAGTAITASHLMDIREAILAAMLRGVQP